MRGLDEFQYRLLTAHQYEVVRGGDPAAFHDLVRRGCITVNDSDPAGNPGYDVTPLGKLAVRIQSIAHAALK